MSGRTVVPTESLPRVVGNGYKPAVELRQVTKEYPGEPPVVALDAVDLTIGEGEIVAIVGPSGSGKSTLLNVIGTLDRPTTGEVVVAGEGVAAGTSDRRLSALRCRLIGFVFQDFHLLDGASALENVATGLLYTGTGRRERARLATTALEQVGLGHRIDHRPGMMSGGERQRVAIARAIVGEPTVLLADEPTGNLDTKTSDAVIEVLADLNASGVTVIVITHDQEVAARFPRRIGVRDGRIESDEFTPIRATPDNREVVR